MRPLAAAPSCTSPPAAASQQEVAAPPVAALLRRRPCAPPGKGLDLVRLFFSLLPQRQRWVEAQAQAAEFIIDETFGVPGVGTVVAGAVCVQWLRAASHARGAMPLCIARLHARAPRL